MSNKSTYLKAMGIDVWVEREPKITQSNIDVTSQKVEVAEVYDEPSEKVETVNIESLDWATLQTHVANCKQCELSKVRTKINFGAGDQSASLMIVADDSDEQSAKLLTSMLKAMGYQRNDIYISNIVKCVAAENKDVSESQAESCEPYLLRQISLLQPKLILALGNAAAQRLLKSKSTMSRLRGQMHYVDGITAPILVSYHPTYLLAAPNEKRKAWEDLQLAMKELSK